MVVLKGKFAKQTEQFNIKLQFVTEATSMVNTPILHGRRADFRNISQGVNIGRDKSARRWTLHRIHRMHRVHRAHRAHRMHRVHKMQRMHSPRAFQHRLGREKRGVPL